MSQSPLSLLLLEDNPGDARLLREGLSEIHGATFEITHVQTLSHALDRLAHGVYDVGVVDLGLPDAKGLQVVREVHDIAPEMPLLVLTALNDEAFAVQSLQEGAQDYLVKGNVDGDALWRALRYAMERHQLQVGLRSLSLVDDLTGLKNRKGFLTLANHHAKLAYRTGKTFVVGFIDMDDLKHINDTRGHQEGNHALVEVAGVLRDSFRQSDILGRYGGDEFVVLLADAVEANAAMFIRRIEDKVSARNAQPGRSYSLSVSIGIAASDTSRPADVDELLHRADALMYQQKQDRRRNRPQAATSSSGRG
jgi:two-component system cell cycle response regulator